jgi:hypothetical protein
LFGLNPIKMRKIVLSIPENKYKFFLEFMKDLELEKAAVSENYSVSQKEQDLILERKKNSNSSTQKDWEEIKNSFKFD